MDRDLEAIENLKNRLGCVLVTKDVDGLLELMPSIAGLDNSSLRIMWKDMEQDLSLEEISWLSNNIKNKKHFNLTDQQKKQKEEAENRILDSLQRLFFTGKDLNFIKEESLYLVDFPSWELYCTYKLGISPKAADNLIKSYRVFQVLQGRQEATELLPNEFVAKELYSPDENKIVEVWCESLEFASNMGKPVTVEIVKTVKASKSIRTKSLTDKLIFNIGDFVSYKIKDKFVLWGKFVGLHGLKCLVRCGYKIHHCQPHCVSTFHISEKQKGINTNILKCPEDSLISNILSQFYYYSEYNSPELAMIDAAIAAIESAQL